MEQLFFKDLARDIGGQVLDHGHAKLRNHLGFQELQGMPELEDLFLKKVGRGIKKGVKIGQKVHNTGKQFGVFENLEEEELDLEDLFLKKIGKGIKKGVKIGKKVHGVGSQFGVFEDLEEQPDFQLVMGDDGVVRYGDLEDLFFKKIGKGIKKGVKIGKKVHGVGSQFGVFQDLEEEPELDLEDLFLKKIGKGIKKGVSIGKKVHGVGSQFGVFENLAWLDKDGNVRANSEWTPSVQEIDNSVGYQDLQDLEGLTEDQLEELFFKKVGKGIKKGVKIGQKVHNTGKQFGVFENLEEQPDFQLVIGDDGVVRYGDLEDLFFKKIGKGIKKAGKFVGKKVAPQVAKIATKTIIGKAIPIPGVGQLIGNKVAGKIPNKFVQMLI